MHLGISACFGLRDSISILGVLTEISGARDVTDYPLVLCTSTARVLFHAAHAKTQNTKPPFAKESMPPPPLLSVFLVFLRKFTIFSAHDLLVACVCRACILSLRRCVYLFFFAFFKNKFPFMVGRRPRLPVHALVCRRHRLRVADPSSPSCFIGELF